VEEWHLKISCCDIKVFIYSFQNDFVCSDFESVCVCVCVLVKTSRVDSESDLWSEHGMSHFPSHLACH